MGLYAKDDFIDAGAGNDQVMALEHDDTIQGGTGNDSIEAGEGDDVLVGGSGSDILSGDAGNDIYRFGLGSDLDVITNGSTVLTDHDVIELGEGITTENIRLARSGDALVIDIDGHADRLIVLGHFITDEHWSRGGPIDALHFADGTIWVQEDILAKLVAPLEAIAVNIDGVPYADLQDAGGYFIGIQNTLGEVHRETAGATWFDIGPGEARLFGGASGDTYVFGKGYGSQAIHDAGGTDRILFNADLSPSDVTLYKLGNDMEVHVEGQSPLTIVGFRMAAYQCREPGRDLEWNCGQRLPAWKHRQ
jgi:Ca2+-binding RTX toxin-like protein